MSPHQHITPNRITPNQNFGVFIFLLAGTAIAFTGLYLFVEYAISHPNRTNEDSNNEDYKTTDHIDPKADSRNNVFSNYTNLLTKHNPTAISLTIAIGFALLALVSMPFWSKPSSTESLARPATPRPNNTNAHQSSLVQ